MNSRNSSKREKYYIVQKLVYIQLIVTRISRDVSCKIPSHKHVIEIFFPKTVLQILKKKKKKGEHLHFRKQVNTCHILNKWLSGKYKV